MFQNCQPEISAIPVQRVVHSVPPDPAVQAGTMGLRRRVRHGHLKYKEEEKLVKVDTRFASILPLTQNQQQSWRNLPQASVGPSSSKSFSTSSVSLLWCCQEDDLRHRLTYHLLFRKCLQMRRYLHKTLLREH